MPKLLDQVISKGIQVSNYLLEPGPVYNPDCSNNNVKPLYGL